MQKLNIAKGKLTKANIKTSTLLDVGKSYAFNIEAARFASSDFVLGNRILIKTPSSTD